MWMKEAGMDGFETFWKECKRALERDSSVWPEGLSHMDYGFLSGIGRPPQDVP